MEVFLYVEAKSRNKIATTEFHYLRMRLRVIRESRMRNERVYEENGRYFITSPKPMKQNAEMLWPC
jgi:hypothetical protein